MVCELKANRQVVQGSRRPLVGLPVENQSGFSVMPIKCPESVRAGEPFKVKILFDRGQNPVDSRFHHIRSISLFYETESSAVFELGNISVTTQTDRVTNHSKAALMCGGFYTAWLTAKESGTIHAVVVSNQGSVSKSTRSVRIY
jgi:hypothetical protein